MKILYGLQMTQKLNDFLTSINNKKHATQSGTNAHLLLKHIIIDGDIEFGDKSLITEIKKHPGLQSFFGATAKTEVPIAGTINGVFISRRIDRLLINSETKTIEFIDYKTDTDKSLFIEKYTKQLHEYAQLLQSAYQKYKIIGYILWIQDWNLEKIINI